MKESRVSPMGLFRYGSEFLSAAKRVKDPDQPEHMLDHSAPTPAYYLVGHSIELFLKAFLRGKGKTLKELRQIGHNLSEAVRASEDDGLTELVQLNDDDRGYVDLLNETYSAKDFEYFKMGFRQLPHYKVVFVIASNLRAGIKDFAVEKTKI